MITTKSHTDGTDCHHRPLRRVHSAAVFKRQLLKTFLFDRAFN